MKKILISVMTLVLVLGLVGAGAFALFSDVEEVEQNEFSTGTVNIEFIGGGTSYLPFNVTNMAPGDSVNGSISVYNAGSLDLRYTMTTTVDGPDLGLANKLQVKITRAYPLETYYEGSLSGANFTSRVLLPGAPGLDTHDALGFIVTLPLGTGNNWQDKSVDVTFVFTAEQTANNP